MQVVDGAAINELPFGKVRDSNRPELLALFSSLGYEAVDGGIATDECVFFVDVAYISYPIIFIIPTCRLDDTINKLTTALRQCDVIVTSGGVSMGEKVKLII